MAESDDKQNKNILFLSFLRNVVQIIERHKYLAIPGLTFTKQQALS